MTHRLDDVGLAWVGHEIDIVVGPDSIGVVEFALPVSADHPGDDLYGLPGGPCSFEGESQHLHADEPGIGAWPNREGSDSFPITTWCSLKPCSYP